MYSLYSSLFTCCSNLFWHFLAGRILKVLGLVVVGCYLHKPLTVNLNHLLVNMMCVLVLVSLVYLPTCLIYSLVVNTNSKYTSHFGSS